MGPLPLFSGNLVLKRFDLLNVTFGIGISCSFFKLKLALTTVEGLLIYTSYMSTLDAGVWVKKAPMRIKAPTTRQSRHHSEWEVDGPREPKISRQTQFFFGIST